MALRTEPGQKAHIFILFRDEWLPRALHEMRAEDEGKPVDDVPPTRYLYKRNQNLTTDEPCVRAVHGWQDLHYAPKKEPKKARLNSTGVAKRVEGRGGRKHRDG